METCQRLKGHQRLREIDHRRGRRSKGIRLLRVGIKAFDLKKTLEMDPEFRLRHAGRARARRERLCRLRRPARHMLLVNDAAGDRSRTQNDYLPMKGVLAVAGSPKKFVYQAVGGIFPRRGTKHIGALTKLRGNKLVFIGEEPRQTILRGASRLVMDTRKQGQNRRGG